MYTCSLLLTDFFFCGVTTVFYYLDFLKIRSRERGFIVTKTHTKLTPNPIATEQASSENARPTTQTRF